MSKNIVHLIDCMEYMKDVPDKYYQLSIVDPPYGIGVSQVGKMTSSSKKEYDKKDWDLSIPGKGFFDELRRISENQIIWGVNFFDGMGLGGGRIIWNKLGKDIGRRNPMPNLSDCEIAYCSMRNNVKMFSYTQIGNVFGNSYKVDWVQDRIHPTQKPVALYKWLLQNYAKTNDKIFVSHVGSGSSRIACYDLGFDFMGCELDPDYWKAQEELYKQHTMQGDLFSGSDLQSSILGGTV